MTTIGVVCGGVGAARFLRAMAGVWPTEHTVGVVNTGDDTVLHGLSISPDLDTITYTLAGAIDPERGWGLRDETWRAMEALVRFVPVRPDGSGAAPTWFNLGDQDLATHFYRTARLAEGATLTAVTAEITAAFGLPQRLVPMSDQRVTTMVSLADEHVEVPFQEYFVQRRHGVPVDGVRFDAEPGAALTDTARAALADSAAVVIAPSNPLVSIGPASTPRWHHGARRSWPCRPSWAAPHSRVPPIGCSSNSATRRRWWVSPVSTRPSRPRWSSTRSTHTWPPRSRQPACAWWSPRAS
jgi:LPPG:FO 2-phospho-L-lactate transferase